MFLVFKKTKGISHLLLALMLILFSFKALAYERAEFGEMDTMTMFHESETRAEVLDHYELRDQLQEFLFEIYYLNNHGEPYTEPVKIIIGYKFKENDFRRMSRRFMNLRTQKFMEAKQYCSFGEPQVMQRKSFASAVGIDLAQVGPEHTLGKEGEYLILPVFKYDDQLGECNLNKAEFEVFSIEALKEEISS